MRFTTTSSGTRAPPAGSGWSVTRSNLCRTARRTLFGSPFAQAMGARPVLYEMRRRLDLSTADTSGYDALLAGAYRHAAGYSLVRWVDRAPDEYLADVAYLDGRLMADAPTGDLDWEPENVDGAQVRDNEARRQAAGDTVYHSGLRHDATGHLVAWTALALEDSAQDHAWQQITIVDPEHRGHRLGTIVKIENLRYARSAQPLLRTVDTWNADSNGYMISINEALGFRPADHSVQWQQTVGSGTGDCLSEPRLGQDEGHGLLREA